MLDQIDINELIHNPAVISKFNKYGIITVKDLLEIKPHRYRKKGRLVVNLIHCQIDEEVSVQGQIIDKKTVSTKNGLFKLTITVRAYDNRLFYVNFFSKNKYFLTKHSNSLTIDDIFLFSGKISEFRNQKQLSVPEYNLLPDFIDPLHFTEYENKYFILDPVYPSHTDLPSWKIKESIDLVIENIDSEQYPKLISKSLITKYDLFSYKEAIIKLHHPACDLDWKKARYSLAWYESLIIQIALASLAHSEKAKANQLVVKGNRWVDEISKSFDFVLSRGQTHAIEYFLNQMTKDKPMRMLLQADVGAGKTMVAFLCAVQCVQAGYKALIIAPTQVLAQQHFTNFQAILLQNQLLSNSPRRKTNTNLSHKKLLITRDETPNHNIPESASNRIPLYFLTSALDKRSKTQTLDFLHSDNPGIVVGTHSLLQDSISIENLGFVTIDEQQRFGVEQREQINHHGDKRPHLLIMSATPIPRTIASTYYTDLELYQMDSIRKGSNIETYLVCDKKEKWLNRIWQLVAEEVYKGNKIYVISPRIQTSEIRDSDLPTIESTLKLLKSQTCLQNIEIAVAHGKQTAADNERNYQDFFSGKKPILVCTSVVEVGVSDPNATMIVILGSQQFGISQLHQLRGRVGRKGQPSRAMLIHPENLNSDTKKRLEAVAKTNDGFELSEIDLKIRNIGDVLGGQQWGQKTGLKFLDLCQDEEIINSTKKEAIKILKDNKTNVQDLMNMVDNFLQNKGKWINAT